jgi:iron complex transport system substrate-binding protein
LTKRTRGAIIFSDLSRYEEREIYRKFLLTTVLSLCAAGFCLVITGCTQESTQTTDRSAPGRDGAEGEVRRIVCAAPSITEIVFALGVGDRVVGVSTFSTHPPEALILPKIGGLIDPNREKITSLEPDLLIIQGQNESLARFSEEHRIRLLSIKIDNMEDIWSAIHEIGQTLKVQGEASTLIQNIKTDLQRIKDQIKEHPPKKVFLTLGHTPGDLTGLMTTGPGTFLHELVSAAGGENIFADASALYPQISKESLIKRQPHIIIEAIPGGIPQEKFKLLKKDWSQLPMLPAVKSGSIHYLTEDFLLIPGVRIALTVRRFAEIIHPEAFSRSSDA